MTGSSKQTTQTTNSGPWPGAQPALQQGISEATRLYNNGTGAQIYTGQTFADPSWDSRAAADESNRIGYQNIGGRGLSGQYQSVINSGGYNPAQLAALKNTQNVANSSFNINEDPGFKQVIDQATNSVNGNASAAGRYGSGTNQQLLGNTIGDLGARQYQAWQSRKDAANSNLFNMGQTGIGNLGAAYQGMSAPVNDLAKAGAFHDNWSTQQLNDRLRIFNDQQTRPWENLSRLNAIASGAGQLGSTQTTSQPGQNPFLTALGYGTTGLGLLGSF
jgi:hypothetical protein